MKLRTEIGHVVMTDRVGYSKLTLEQKAILDRELLEAVQTCPAVLEAESEDLIVTDSGDGVALIFFNDPVPAAESAIYIFERVAKNAGVKLRIGIHSGPLMRRIDASGKANVTGPGIDKAQRTMNQSDGSCVLVSEFFAENLRAFEDWRDMLLDFGEHTIKHGETLHLYQLKTKKGSGDRIRICLLYRRRAHPDEFLVQSLENRLTEVGFDVYVDRHESIGVAWAQDVERQIRQSDMAVVLVSEQSVGSEMLLYELNTAKNEFEATGSPRIIPVRVQFEAPLSGEVGALVNRFHCLVWNQATDDEELCRKLVEAVSEPEKPTAETSIAVLEPAGGAVPLDSKYYIERRTDEEFHHSITNRDSIVLIKGGRQMGKTSLLARGLSNATRAGSRVVLTDFQSFSSAQLQTDERLYQSLAYQLSTQIGLDLDIRATWNEWLGANSNLERFVDMQILSKVDGHLIWAMDEVDRLFALPFATDFFGMIRSWHNSRALRPESRWSRLTIAISYATEAHLFITDLNQSPFNVGTRLALDDFTVGQVAELNQRYGSPLRSPVEESRFWRLTGGQPYLCRRGLDELVRKSISFSQLEAQAESDEGPFGDHLRRILIGVSNQSSLMKDTKSVLHATGVPTAEGFYRLRTAGIFVGDSPSSARIRAELYRSYLLLNGL